MQPHNHKPNQQDQQYMNLYYKDQPVEEFVYSDLASDFKLPYEVVSEVIAQIKKDGYPSISRYSGIIRANIEDMFNQIYDNDKAEESNIIEPDVIANEDSIVEQAATSLMQVVTESEGGHFIVNSNGICKINEDNPPNLEQSYIALSKVLQLGELAERMEDNHCWMLGSMTYALEELHSEAGFCVSQIVDDSSKSYNTVSTSLAVYKRFKDKRYNVSFSHHKEAYRKKIPSQITDLILKKAEVFNLSTKQVRQLCAYYIQHEDEESIKNIKSEQQAKDLVDAFTQVYARFYYFEDGQWFTKKAVIDNPPEGRIVIDATNNKVSIDGEKQEDIKEVKPHNK